MARAFLDEFVADNPAVTARRFSPEALEAMLAFQWPGNVRQLRNAIERAATLGAGEAIQLADLPRDVREAAPAEVAAEVGAAGVETERRSSGSSDSSVDASVDDETFQEMKARKVAAIENSYLTTLLRRHAGNVTRCAEDAGMSRQAFQKLMQRYSIRSSDYRGDRDRGD
jgi:two-component system response regulator AtoC